MRPHYPASLFIIYLVVAAWSAIRPNYYNGWAAEMVLPVAFVVVLVVTYRKFPLSRISYTLIFMYLLLHTIGAHYTYAEVPFGNWLQEVFSLERNPYDRIVHFNFGLLLAYPVREVFLRVASTRGAWGYWLPLELTLAFSAIYEIIEWGVAVVSPGGGTAFLATQGDQFDAQKDMALAGLGALFSMGGVMAYNIRNDPWFMENLRRSLTIKRHRPLGEVRLREMVSEMRRRRKERKQK